jgi:hypothetical protein
VAFVVYVHFTCSAFASLTAPEVEYPVFVRVLRKLGHLSSGHYCTSQPKKGSAMARRLPSAMMTANMPIDFFI